MSLLIAQKGGKHVYTQTRLKQCYSRVVLSQISIFVFYEILFNHFNHRFVPVCATAAHQHPSIQLTGAEAFLYFAFSKWQTRMRGGRTAAAGPAEDLLRCWRAGGRLLTFITHDGLKPSFSSSQRWKGSQQVPMILLPSVPLWLYASITLTPLIPP